MTLVAIDLTLGDTSWENFGDRPRVDAGGGSGGGDVGCRTGGRARGRDGGRCSLGVEMSKTCGASRGIAGDRRAFPPVVGGRLLGMSSSSILGR